MKVTLKKCMVRKAEVTTDVAGGLKGVSMLGLYTAEHLDEPGAIGATHDRSHDQRLSGIPVDSPGCQKLVQ
jgi:hypothetical protein